MERLSGLLIKGNDSGAALRVASDYLLDTIDAVKVLLGRWMLQTFVPAAASRAVPPRVLESHEDLARHLQHRGRVSLSRMCTPLLGLEV